MLLIAVAGARAGRYFFRCGTVVAGDFEMAGPPVHYPVENGIPVIEVRLANLDQLFNSLDPSPFYEKDLDADAEEYIVGSINDFPLSQPVKIIVYLPPSQIARVGADSLADAIHNNFEYALSVEQRRLRFTFRNGRTSLLIGLAFLFVCVTLREAIRSMYGGTLADIAAEGLLISGWVAMWRPIDTFLYGWWPVRHTCRLHRRLTTIPVEVRPLVVAGAAARQ